MGCDITVSIERKGESGYESITMEDLFSPGDFYTPFGHRNYGVFAFLAGVRNDSMVTPISEPRGLPDDISRETHSDFDYEGAEYHSESWLSVQELLDYDYDQTIEDRRRRGSDGSDTVPEGEGKKIPLRWFLGPNFFKDIMILKLLGADRIVLWFSN